VDDVDLLAARRVKGQFVEGAQEHVPIVDGGTGRDGEPGQDGRVRARGRLRPGEVNTY
jgi:hypothetical protein